MNNKCYVFTPLLVLLFVLITLVVVSVRQELVSSVNQLVIIDGFIDKSYFDYSKLLINEVNKLKLIFYGNLSDLSLVDDFNNSVGGLLVNDSLIVPLSVPPVFYASGFANLSYNACFVSVLIDYPLIGLLSAYDALDLSLIQNCLDANYCVFHRGDFSSIFVNCLNSYPFGFFSLSNSSVPFLVGSSINVNLVLSADSGITSIYPFSIGSFVFDC